MRDVRRWTRRAFLYSGMAASGLGAENDKGIFPSEWRRFADPVTEFEVERLTDPAHASYLPAYYERALARRGNFLLYAGDRTGSLQAFRMDLKSGETRQLTHAEGLDGSSLTLMPDERSFCYFDGLSLRQMNLSNLRGREIYRVTEGWQRCPGCSVSDDGVYATFGESRGESSRLRLIRIAHGSAQTVAETPWKICHPQVNPRRAQILYRQGDLALWLVNTDGGQNRKLKLGDGRVGPSRWSPDGRTILYLNFPDDSTQLNSIREYTPDQNADRLISKTSQFAHFGVNANSSVFVGASQNRASPHILLLLRVARRELTLCEHRASDPRIVSPMFSPDSQKVYFESDRHGKPAIYRMRVDKLVEAT